MIFLLTRINERYDLDQHIFLTAIEFLVKNFEIKNFYLINTFSDKFPEYISDSYKKEQIDHIYNETKLEILP